jgi:hypothetical protein
LAVEGAACDLLKNEGLSAVASVEARTTPGRGLVLHVKVAPGSGEKVKRLLETFPVRVEVEIA